MMMKKAAPSVRVIADELENAQAFLNALDEETEPIRAAE
jgi:hypothetical protein